MRSKAPAAASTDAECFEVHLTTEPKADSISITTVSDIRVMLLDSKVIGDLLNQTPALTAEIADAIWFKTTGVDDGPSSQGQPPNGRIASRQRCLDSAYVQSFVSETARDSAPSYDFKPPA
jgi:hypothetical protein